MTFVAKIEFENWGPFAGAHLVELEPTTYGISGPNWAGKSRLIAAVPFALYEVNPERLEDDWITDGARAGMVRVTLSDGAKVERGRKRGKSTQVVLTPAGSDASIQGASAIAEVAKMLVLSREDFFASCYFRQKAISQIVTMDPAPRLEIFSSWIGLEHADRCVEIAAALHDVAERELALAESRVTDVKTWLGQTDDKAELAAIEAVSHAEQALEEIRIERELDESDRAARQFAAVVDDGKRLKAELEGYESAEAVTKALASLAEDTTTVDADIGAARADRRRSLALVEGGFDGTCPVAGIECPARAELEGSIEEARTRVAELDTAIEEHAAVKNELVDLTRSWTDYERGRASIETRIEGLRTRAKELIAEMGGKVVVFKGELPSGEEIVRRKNELASLYEAAVRTHQQAVEWLAQLREKQAELVEREKELAEARERARACGAAVVVCEKARREVLRGSTGDIERGSNAILARCAVDLRVAFRWEREGKDLARNCGECGAGFPPSKKVKECARCGAKRGPSVSEKLEIVPSDVSGAAEDLAGVAVQLSAAGWLRRRRQAPWTSAFLDEPFGALDELNRKALAQHLAAALTGEGGFRQAFVVAHQPDALAGMKRQIEVVPGPSGSTVRVA